MISVATKFKPGVDTPVPEIASPWSVALGRQPHLGEHLMGSTPSLTQGVSDKPHGAILPRFWQRLYWISSGPQSIVL